MRLSSLVGCFFLSVIPYCVSLLLCFWILAGPSPSLSASFRSKFSLRDGVALWDESVLLQFVPLSYSLGVSSAIVDCCIVSLFVSVSGVLFWTLPFFLRPSVAFGFSLLLCPPPWLRVTSCGGVCLAAPFSGLSVFRPAWSTSLLCLPSPFCSHFPPWGLCVFHP